MSIISKLPVEDWGKYKSTVLEMYRTDPDAWSSTLFEYQAMMDDYWRRLTENACYEFNEVAFFAFESEDKKENPIGMIGVTLDRRSRVRHVATIINFYVKSEYRGKKVGKDLFQKAIEYIQSKSQIEKIKLSVTSSQKLAYDFYISQGFNETGRWNDEIKTNETDYLDLIWMEKKLQRN